MMKKMWTLPSPDGSDQGFLNHYFTGLIHAPLFNWSDSAMHMHKHMRLPPEANSCLHGQALKVKSPKILHFTGGMKPWIWWMPRYYKWSWIWWNVCNKLHCTYDESNHGAIFWAPYPLLVLLFAGLKFFFWPLRVKCNSSVVNVLNKRFSHYIPLTILTLAYYLAFTTVVPTIMLPSLAEYVFWLWTSFFLLLLMGVYCFLAGMHANTEKRLMNKVFQSFVLYAVLTISHIAQLVVQTSIATVYDKPVVFIILTVIHALVGQVTGEMTILVWTQ